LIHGKCRRIASTSIEVWSLWEKAAMAQFISQLRHTNVLLLMGVCKAEGDKLLLVTELMRGGSVYDLLHLRGQGVEPPTLLRRLVIARDCCLGMAHMHRQSILHLDLKPQNLLLADANGPTKIADFGQSEILRGNSLKSGIYGTLAYMAPEILKEEEVTTKTDVYRGLKG
jgi:serine/threonine protein kinase